MMGWEKFATDLCTWIRALIQRNQIHKLIHPQCPGPGPHLQRAVADLFSSVPFLLSSFADLLGPGAVVQCSRAILQCTLPVIQCASPVLRGTRDEIQDCLGVALVPGAKLYMVMHKMILLFRWRVLSPF